MHAEESSSVAEQGRPGAIVAPGPLSPAAILTGALRLFRVTAAPAATVGVVVYGPLHLLLAVAQIGVDPRDPVGSSPNTLQAVLLLLGLTASVLLLPLATAAITWLARERDRGVDLGWQAALGAAGARYPALLATVVLLALLGAAALLLLGVPVALLTAVTEPLAAGLGVLGAILLVLGLTAVLHVAVPAVLFEERSGWAGITRAVRLLRPRWWPAVTVVLTAGLGLAVAGVALAAPFGAAALALGPAGFVLDALGGTAASVVTLPVSANLGLLLYLDACRRRDDARGAEDRGTG